MNDLRIPTQQHMLLARQGFLYQLQIGFARDSGRCHLCFLKLPHSPPSYLFIAIKSQHAWRQEDIQDELQKIVAVMLSNEDVLQENQSVAGNLMSLSMKRFPSVVGETFEFFDGDQTLEPMPFVFSFKVKLFG